MKRTIDWHAECHANASASLAAKKKRALDLQEEIRKDEAALEFRTMQIIEARDNRGMTEFDADKLLCNRKKTS